MKQMYYIFFILLGILLYKYIQNIEGLTCFSPFHNTLGNNVGSQYNKPNKGSYPVLLKDNLVLKNNGTKVDFTREQTYENDNTLSVVCDPGDSINAPWQLAGTSTDKVLRCKNPTNRVIIHAHGSFLRQDIIDFILEVEPGQLRSILGGFYFGTYNGQPGFRVFKRMQMITYMNRGDCLSLSNNSNGWPGFLYKILTDNENRLTDFRSFSLWASDSIRDFFGKGYSELTTFNKVFVFSDEIDDSVYIEKIKVGGEVEQESPELPLLNQIYDVNSCSITLPNDSAAIVHNLVPPMNGWLHASIVVHRNIEKLLKFNVLTHLGPFHNNTCIIITIEMQDILSSRSHPVLSDTFEDLFNLTSIGIDTGYVITLECDVGTISSIRSSIFALLRISSIKIHKNLLSPEFIANEVRLNRLFLDAEEVDLPLFFLNVLMNPMFRNPPSNFDGNHNNPYSLPGGEYTSFDMLEVIYDIIQQIKNNSGGYNTIYRNILKQIGMNPDEIVQFINSLALLVIGGQNNYHGTTNSGLNKDPPVILSTLRDLWLPWGYEYDDLKRYISDYPSMVISGDVIFMLLQLFKQNAEYDYNKLDVHMLTCFSGISDVDSSRRDAEMDYSWEYTWTDQEIDTAREPLDRKIGPTCEKKSCEQTITQINSKISEVGKGDYFEVDEDHYAELTDEGIHPRYKKTRYRRDDQQNIEMAEENEPATYIEVNCKQSDAGTIIECHYDDETNQLNYDQSINRLDPNICSRREPILSPAHATQTACGVKIDLRV